MWLSTDPLQEKYPNISTYAYTFQNPVKYIDPTGMEGDDIVITGENNSSLTLKTDAIDFGGNLEIADLTGLAIGYERGLSAEAQMFAGLKVEGGLQSVLFLGGEHAGYWYDYITWSAGIVGQTGVAASIDATSNFVIAFNHKSELNTPTGFAGVSIQVSAEIGVELGVAGAGISGSFSTAWDGGWSALSLGTSAGIDPQVGIFDGGYFGGSLTGGDTFLLKPNNVVPTRDRSKTDMIRNWTLDRIFIPINNK